MSPNQHITKYPDDYLELDPSPGFAVLLNGPWGCGKTHFIKAFRDGLDQEKTKTVHVSLYGIGSRDAFGNAILAAVHSWTARKDVKIGFAVASFLLRSVRLDVDLNISDGVDGKASAGGSDPKLRLNNFLPGADARLFIFDDLERCAMPASVALGYINQFVEQDGRHVVILADEEKIKDPDYKDKKEKVIGKTFKVQSVFEPALKSFLAAIKDEETRELFEKKRDIIREIYDQSELNNLRILRQTMWEFERFHKKLCKKHKQHDEAITTLLRLIFALSFELMAGRLTADDLRERKKTIFDYYDSEKKRNRETGSKEQANDDQVPAIVSSQCRYANIDLRVTWLTDKTLDNILIKGKIKHKFIEQDLNNSPYFFSYDSEPAWKSLCFSGERPDDAIEGAQNILEQEFEERKYTHEGEILHVIGLRLWLARIKAFNHTQDDVVEQGKRYIDDLIDHKKLIAMNQEHLPDNSPHNGYDRVDSRTKRNTVQANLISTSLPSSERNASTGVW